ncbi:MAG: metallopeptidase family protein [Chloroflexi bacterium]|nr:metallopeptidase family protein [Chloroflexota bacterium]MYI03872.1 metallopeptidase family protein [Chloroflexota bacterium]
MRRSRFRRLVERALDEIPDELAGRMDNVVILVRNQPTEEELESVGLSSRETLLGLYVGRPLTSRGWYGETLPDRIMIYQQPIESICRSEDEVVEQVRETVLHEVAHHFGIDDDRLDEIGIAPPPRHHYRAAINLSERRLPYLE